jgi:hypothetical protein
MTAPLASRMPLNLPRVPSSKADHVLGVLSALVQAVEVAGSDVEREARSNGDAPLLEFARVTQQGAMRSLDYCFTPRRSGQWRPSNVLWSEPACALTNVAGAPRRSEHVYPLNLLSRDLLAVEPTVETFESIVTERLVITVAEDLRLGAAGLSRSMPAAWDGYDPFDRYHAALSKRPICAWTPSKPAK